jgi:hypothetical protein
MNRGIESFPRGDGRYIVAGMYNDAPSASLVIARHPFPLRVSFPAAFSGSYFKAETAATAQTDFDVQKDGVSVGTIRFAASGTSAIFIVAAGPVYPPGAVLKIVAPASPDATLAGIHYALLGTRITL